jgi:3-oxoacyl-[acyl-carrier protein] reductase
VIALITGASRGIGRATAEAFAARGLQVVLLGRNGEELASAASALGGHAFVCDVGDPLAITRVTREILNELGAPDIVVNNAGVVERAAVDVMTDEQWDHVLHVNLRGPFQITRAFLPAMRARGSGRILHVGSISSTLGTARMSAYCAAKWGLLGFMKSLAEELRGTGLQTAAILPGSVDTAMLEGSGFAPQMTAADVANAIVYAALDAPAAIHGSAIEMFGP